MEDINMTYDETCQYPPAEEPARQYFFIERCRALWKAGGSLPEKRNSPFISPPLAAR